MRRPSGVRTASTMTAVGMGASKRQRVSTELDRAVKFGAADRSGSNRDSACTSGSLPTVQRLLDHPPRRVGVERRTPLAGLARRAAHRRRRGAGRGRGPGRSPTTASRPAVIYSSDLGRARADRRDHRRARRARRSSPTPASANGAAASGRAAPRRRSTSAGRACATRGGGGELDRAAGRRGRRRRVRRASTPRSRARTRARRRGRRSSS